MKIKQIILGFMAMVGLLGSVVVPAHTAYALQCGTLPQDVCDAATKKETTESGIWKILIMGINILSAGIGIVAVGYLAYAGFLYATAQEKADQVKQSKEMILNTVIGLLIFGAMYAFLQWLIPGGVFR